MWSELQSAGTSESHNFTANKDAIWWKPRAHSRKAGANLLVPELSKFGSMSWVPALQANMHEVTTNGNWTPTVDRALPERHFYAYLYGVWTLSLLAF